MRYLELDGRRLSRVGLGCWQLGEKGWGYGTEYSREDALAIVRRALELGVTVFDTAELYGRGASERLLGEGLRGWQGDRLLATKFLPVLPLPRVMRAHCERSLERLQVPLLDLYQIHAFNPVVPLRRQMAGMRGILDRGWSRHIGVSNFSQRRWAAAERALGRPVISNQVRYNLLQRGPEDSLLDYASRGSRLVIAYSPLAQGLLGGRYRPGETPSGLRRANPMFSDQALVAAAPVLTLVRELADAHQCTPAQIALAYVLAHPRVLAIPGAKSLSQLESNVAAADILLSPEEQLALRRAADLFQYPRVRAGLEVAGRLLRHRRGGAR